MEKNHQQQDAQGKTFQKMSYRKLMKIGENKDTLDMLTDAIRNISIQSKFNTQLLHMMHPVSPCRQALKVSGKYMKKIESMEASNENTRTKLEALKNHVIPKMDHIQGTSETELKEIVENKNTLDMLIDTVQNISMQARLTTRLFNFMYPSSSCRQAPNVSDTYMIKIGENSEPFQVFCEQNMFEGGWTVIQHRFNGSVDFYRNWTEYRNGFGALDGEFWLGLEYLHQITKTQPHELLVEVKDFPGNYGYAKYDGFEIGSESELYALKKLGRYSGTAGDSMRDNKDEKFSTFDRDNSKSNCAKQRRGAWWYYDCSSSNLNGRYQKTMGDTSAMVWYSLINDWRGLSYSRIMIRGTID